MAKDHGPSVKDDALYEKLREEGESYEDRTVEELRERAAEIGIEGRSDMDKGELIDALRNH